MEGWGPVAHNYIDEVESITDTQTPTETPRDHDTGLHRRLLVDPSACVDGVQDALRGGGAAYSVGPT
jgi:hypothetical protein